MLGMGWQEIFLVAVVAVLVVGPKELPRVLRTVSYWIRKLRGMAREFQSGVDDVIRESELQDIRKELEDTTSLDVSKRLINSVDPAGDIGDAVRDIEHSIESPTDPTDPTDNELIRDEAAEAAASDNSAAAGDENGAPDDELAEAPKQTGGLA
jgi:sec-independent protein translocase protein TatB